MKIKPKSLSARAALKSSSTKTKQVHKIFVLVLKTSGWDRCLQKIILYYISANIGAKNKCPSTDPLHFGIFYDSPGTSSQIRQSKYHQPSLNNRGNYLPHHHKKLTAAATRFFVCYLLLLFGTEVE